MTPEEAEEFVKECEKKFADRYTGKDPEYDRVCRTLDSGGSVPPTIVGDTGHRQRGNNDHHRSSWDRDQDRHRHGHHQDRRHYGHHHQRY